MTAATGLAATINTYRVTITHPDLDGPLVMDLIATSGARAHTRARYSAMHMYRDVRLLHADSVSVLLHPGTCRDAGHEREECSR